MLLRHAAVATGVAFLVALAYFRVDRPAAVWAHGLDPRVVDVFSVITAFGASKPWLLGLACLWCTLRCALRRMQAARAALFVLASLAAVGVVDDLVKWLSGRARPALLFEQPAQYGFFLMGRGYLWTSFPSGHTGSAFALACSAALLFPRLRAALFGAAGLIGISRVVVGAHFPGDVIAGAWLGTVVALALVRTPWFRGAAATSRV